MNHILRMIGVSALLLLAPVSHAKLLTWYVQEPARVTGYFQLDTVTHLIPDWSIAGRYAPGGPDDFPTAASYSESDGKSTLHFEKWLHWDVSRTLTLELASPLPVEGGTVPLAADGSMESFFSGGPFPSHWSVKVTGLVLTTKPIPEPSASFIVVAGLIGLLALRARIRA